MFINKYKERPGRRSSTQTYNEKEYVTLYAFFVLGVVFQQKRALLKAPNEQDLYKKGAQDMVCMLLNLCADLIQNPYLKIRSLRVRALGLLVLVFPHGFSKRIEHIEDNM
ncbi:hypothetical protein [Bacillus cereus]|uniref:hypothetical protein n=3 Tax=Bacillus cereus TaxID=1396 RepID=UPI001F0A067E|nr:hypothetical protein [Bacillus cereus]